MTPAVKGAPRQGIDVLISGELSDDYYETPDAIAVDLPHGPQPADLSRISFSGFTR